MSKSIDFQEMVKNIQRKIDNDEEKIYSKKVIKEYRHPINFGNLEKPDATGKIKGPCGDTMRIDLQVVNNVIQDARFWIDGCGDSIACGNILISMIKGKNIDEADAITSEFLLEVLDGLPKEYQHCAKLAVDTLHKVIEDYHKKREKMKEYWINMKHTPCEYIVWYGLPIIRRGIAKSMVEDYGLNQKETAKKLGVTSASVSLYLSGKRGKEDIIDEELCKEINISAKRIIQRCNEFTISEICRICKIFASKKMFPLGSNDS